MAYVKNNIVKNVILAEDDWNYDGYIEFNDENPAYIGGEYLEGYFYPPQIYSSWTKDKGKWLPPVPYPNDDRIYEWSEEQQNWLLVE